MKATVTALLVVGLVAAGWAFTAGERKVSDVVQETDVTPRAVGAMVAAAENFLAALSLEQRDEATFPIDAAERTRWHFLPTELHARNGLMIREMDATQRERAHDLLKAGLSRGGYLTANAVIEMEAVLRDLEGTTGMVVRDPEQYFFSVFGMPSTSGAWGWRVEGHHLSLHFTIVDGNWVATAPAFLGANPAEVREGPQRGLRVLAEREDVARQLLHSLDAAQREIAVISPEAPDGILTMTELDIEPLSPTGLRAGDMRPDQRTLLLDLIDVYASLMADDLAATRLAAIHESGIDDISFAWAGGGERGSAHYYRVQGPTFLVEFDNTQSEANHIHSVWRDFEGDFGRDLLREHLHAVRH